MALPIFIQSVMELIDKQEFMSWKLPKNTTLILSSNPDDSEYNISSLDPAQKTLIKNGDFNIIHLDLSNFIFIFVVNLK